MNGGLLKHISRGGGGGVEKDSVCSFRADILPADRHFSRRLHEKRTGKKKSPGQEVRKHAQGREKR